MADPISYAVGSAVLTATGSFAVASAVATVAYVAVIAAPVVASVVVADRQRRAMQNARGLVNDSAALQTQVPAAAPEHRLILGYGVSAGTPFFCRGGEALRPYLYQGMLHAAHECDGLDSVIINGQTVLIDGDGFATSTPFNDGATQFIQVSVRLGLLDQPIDPILAADFPALPATFRQRGAAATVIKAHYGTGASREARDDKHKELYGDGQFVPLFRWRGAKLYDPRDARCVLEDEATWRFSNNAALAAARYLIWKNPELVSRIDWDGLAVEAEKCDRIRTSKAGDRFRQYTVDGVVLATDPMPDAISDLLSSMGGRLIREGGTFSIVAAGDEQPVGTIHPGNVRGAVQLTNGVPAGQLVNELRPEFFAEDRAWRIVPGPVVTDAADVAADGQVRARTERYPFTAGHARAQRLATRTYREGRAQRGVTLGVDASARGWRAGNVVRLDLASIQPSLTGLWRIARKAWAENLDGWILTLEEFDAAAGNFIPADDEQDFTIDEEAFA